MRPTRTKLYNSYCNFMNFSLICNWYSHHSANPAHTTMSMNAVVVNMVFICFSLVYGYTITGVCV